MFHKNYKIHFIGIGGIGMSGIAEFLHYEGYLVSGSDIIANDITERLRYLGINVIKGHSAINIKDADAVVVSTAIKNDNAEYTAAKNKNIPIIHRSVMLSEIVRHKYCIAVSGAHGKTTTTSIVSAIFESGGHDINVLIGGKLKSRGINAKKGDSNFIVIEADESDGSLLNLHPSIAVITNIDLEHLDYYKNIDDIKETFIKFLNQIPFYGFAVLCYDNQFLREIIPFIKPKVYTYGFDEKADLQAVNISTNQFFRSNFKVKYEDRILGSINLNLPGYHNIYNSLAGILVGLNTQLQFKDIAKALNTLEGVKRRLEIKGVFNEITVIDDYGHHPNEIETTLHTIKDSWPDRRLVVVFQAHRYSRTKALINEFSNAFTKADSLIILPVYSAGEEPIQGINGVYLYKKIKNNGHKQIFYEKSIDDACKFLKTYLKPKDVLLTLGAGDVYKLSENFQI